MAATEYATVPLPLPLEPPVIVTHPADDVAVQAQPPRAVTATEPAVALAATEAPAGESAYVHGWPACVTVKLCPATVMSAIRAVMAGFAVTL